MPELAVKNLKNKAVRKLRLAETVFDYPGKPYLVHEAVVHYLAKGRAGTASTKTRKEVSGGGRKPWRQKKTGRARVGSIRSPLWRGGGTVQGPQPRSYDYAFPRKKRMNALRSVLSEKARDGRLVVVEDLTLNSHRTKDLLATLAVLGLSGVKAMLVDRDLGKDLARASSNLWQVDVAPAMGLNAYDVLNHDVLVLSVAAVEQIQEWLGP